MAFARDLPILGAIALIGAGAGLHLGWSAIGEINPLYFSKAQAASSFHGDLVPGRSYDPGPQLPGMEQADALALGSGCIGCRTYPVDYRPIPDPAIEQVYAPEQERSVGAPVEMAAYEPDPPEQAARRKADLERVELYSRAPVTVEEAVVQTASVETAEPAN
jgi:hypothetical protein